MSRLYLSFIGWLMLFIVSCQKKPVKDQQESLYYVNDSITYENIEKAPLDSLLINVVDRERNDRYVLDDPRLLVHLKKYEKIEASDCYQLFTNYSKLSNQHSQGEHGYQLRLDERGRIFLYNKNFKALVFYIDKHFVVFRPYYGGDGNVLILLDLQKRMAFAFVKNAWQLGHTARHLRNIFFLNGSMMPTVELGGGLYEPNNPNKKYELVLVRYDYNSLARPDDFYLQRIYFQLPKSQDRLEKFTYQDLIKLHHGYNQGRYSADLLRAFDGGKIFYNYPLWTEY
mgnify:CR=1 FL=1